MLVAILTGLVTALILDRIFFPSKDLAGRDATRELAELLNRKVEFYDFIRESGVYTLDYNKEYDCPISKVRLEILKAVKEDMISLRDFMEGKIKKADDRISALAEKAESVDLSITQGVDALANHLKVEIIPFREEAKEGFKIEKLKKSKK